MIGSRISEKLTVSLVSEDNDWTSALNAYNAYCSVQVATGVLEFIVIYYNRERQHMLSQYHISGLYYRGNHLK